MSTSGGATWNAIDSTYEQCMDDGWALVAAGGSIYQAGSWWATSWSTMAVFRSIDRGATWGRSSLSEGENRGEVRAIAISPSDTNLILAGGGTWSEDAEYKRHYASRMCRSTDGGSTWRAVGSGTFGGPEDCITGIAFDSGQPSRVLATSWKGVSASSDGGLTWSGPTMNIDVTCIISDPNVTGRFFLGSPEGVWVSTDYGGTWRQINAGMPSATVLCLSYDPIAKLLYAGTDVAGVFRLNMDAALGLEREGGSAVPVASALEQNYPNPFNPFTIIKFTVGGIRDQGSGPSKTRLVVYDLLGRQVGTLVHEMKQPGSYEVSFNGNGLASGRYYYRLTTGGFVQTRAMLLLK